MKGTHQEKLWFTLKTCTNDIVHGNELSLFCLFEFFLSQLGKPKIEELIWIIKINKKIIQ